MDTRAPALCCHRKRATTCQADVLQGQSREAHRTRSTEQFHGAVRDMLRAVVFKTGRAARLQWFFSYDSNVIHNIRKTYEFGLDRLDRNAKDPCITAAGLNSHSYAVAQVCCTTGAWDCTRSARTRAMPPPRRRPWSRLRSGWQTRQRSAALTLRR